MKIYLSSVFLMCGVLFSGLAEAAGVAVTETGVGTYTIALEVPEQRALTAEAGQQRGDPAVTRTKAKIIEGLLIEMISQRMRGEQRDRRKVLLNSQCADLSEAEAGNADAILGSTTCVETFLDEAP